MHLWYPYVKICFFSANFFRFVLRSLVEVALDTIGINGNPLFRKQCYEVNILLLNNAIIYIFNFFFCVWKWKAQDVNDLLISKELFSAFFGSCRWFPSFIKCIELRKQWDLPSIEMEFPAQVSVFSFNCCFR